MNNVSMKIEEEISIIDRNVARLEKINDNWITAHGEMNSGIYGQIQKLMDRREYLFSLKLS